MVIIEFLQKDHEELSLSLSSRIQQNPPQEERRNLLKQCRSCRDIRFVRALHQDVVEGIAPSILTTLRGWIEH